MNNSTILLIRHGETPWNAVRRLQGTQGIAFVQLDAGDVVRHPVVSRIVGAYGDHANGGRPPWF